MAELRVLFQIILMEEFIRGIPKCELHMHICGNTEPEMIFKLAKRNGIKITKYQSPEELKKAYEFKNLDEFLGLFREGLEVILHENDIYDITYDYFIHAHNDNVLHSELYYSPLCFMEKGLSIEESMNSVIRAMEDAKKNFGITSSIILCCERHNSEDSQIDILDKIHPWRKYISSVGLASAELPFPPKLFVNFFEKSRQMGFKVTIHAGEEGPPEYIYQALDLLKADRIDHGNTAIEDENLMNRLSSEKIPCTMCPLSNLRLNVTKSLKDHPLKKFLDAGIIATVNSDDPSFFRGYINDNFIDIQKALNLTRNDIITLAKNSFISAFISDDEKRKGIEMIDDYVRNFEMK